MARGERGNGADWLIETGLPLTRRLLTTELNRRRNCLLNFTDDFEVTCFAAGASPPAARGRATTGMGVAAVVRQAVSSVNPTPAASSVG